MLSFENTEIAFSNKSNKDLKRAYRLFKLIGIPALTKIGKIATNFALAIHLPIKGIVKKTIFKQFCGGETIEECSATIKSLGDFNIGTILDYSVEGKTDDEDFEATVNEIIDTIVAGTKDPNVPFAVFKITGIAKFSLLEKFNNENAILNEKEIIEISTLRERINRICQTAHDKNVPVFIDAEESWIQDGIDRLAHEMMFEYNKQKISVYNTVQMYRNDRYEFLEKAVKEAKEKEYIYGVKLVRGAYMEKERRRAVEKNYPSPIHKTKQDTDVDYNRALKFCVDNVKAVALVAGTHNEESSKYLAEIVKSSSIVRNDKNIYFAQLLGMSDHISYNLANEGYNVAKYVPYGPVREVMPYLLRRADENTSVAGQTGRELGLITKELIRRKMTQ